MDYAQPAEVAVLRAERAVDQGRLLHQFRSETLQAAQIPLPVTLRRLILLHIIDENFHAAADAAVVQIEPEPPDLDRLPAALVLPGVDASVQLVKNLIVAGKQRPLKHLFVAVVY